MINLDDIEARCNAATPGPWINDPIGDVITEKGVQICDYIPYGANREFVAHAREDVPALVAEVRRLQGDIKTIKDNLLSAALALRGALTSEAEQSVLEALKTAGGKLPEEVPITVAMAALQDCAKAWDAVGDPEAYISKMRETEQVPVRTVETNNTEMVCPECGTRGREVSIEWGSMSNGVAYRCNRCGNRFTA